MNKKEVDVKEQTEQLLNEARNYVIDDMENFLRFNSKIELFKSYSMKNKMLIYGQTQGLGTLAQSFKDWEKWIGYNKFDTFNVVQ